MSRQNPRSMAIAYRIWADCQTHGWDRTITEVADAIGEPVSTVRSIIVHKGWASRFRSVSPHALDTYAFKRHEVADRALEAMS